MTDKKLSKKERKEAKRLEKEEAEMREQKKAERGKYIGWGIGIALLIGIGFFLKYAFTPPPPGTYPEAETIVSSDHVSGATESANLLVEYSDFQCPACKAYEPVLQQLMSEKADQVTFVYRHFPLPQHQNADEAARAAEAASKQDKFWEMHDLLFERQESWSDESNPDETFIGYATELGLDTEQFTTDYNAPETAEKVSNDYTSGVQVGVNSTPTFFLNGQKISPRSYEDFARLIDESTASE